MSHHAAWKNCVFFSLCVVLMAEASAQKIELEYSIQEEVPTNQPIGNIVQHPVLFNYVQGLATRDLRFSFLAEGNPQASYISINETSGDLKTASRIDRETLCRRQVTCELRVQTAVQADLSSFFMLVLVKIVIQDINDNAPAFASNVFSLRIPESEGAGTTYLLPTATDPDTGVGNSIITYNTVETGAPFTLLVSGSSAASFEIRLRLDDSLDREVTPSYQVLVRALDGGEPRLTGTLTVNVEIADVNDNAPVFERRRYSANVSEGNPVDTVVVTVRAADQDVGPNGTVTYVMLPTQDDLDVFSMFAINNVTGEIRTLAPLDKYAGRTYSLSIQAQDSGPTPKADQTYVDISVLDTRNSPPNILLHVLRTAGKTSQVSELAELGRVVAYFSVSDPDPKTSPNSVVTCSTDSDQFELQAMDQNQYKVILSKRLDREQAAYHSVSVTCFDAGSPPLNDTANFLVEVQDENDNAPVFDSLFYTADVSEGPVNADNSIILRVHASDNDVGINSQITYKLADSSDNDFGINGEGDLYVSRARGLDREDKVKGPRRELTVMAIDGGNPALTGIATVVVTVRDVNDNPPKFSEPVYYFNVPENSQSGRIVNNLSATDDDADMSAIFYFKMLPSYKHKMPFEVGLDGNIRVSGDLDRERQANYDFQVIVYDLGEPPLTSTVTVHVKVTDVNDNAPVFMFPNDDNYTLHIPHTLGANTVFANIIATDKDEGRNGALVYSLEGGNGSRFFDIVSDSGKVLLTRPLSVSDVGVHVLNVMAHDLGYHNQESTQAVLHIHVFEGNATLAHLEGGIGFRNILVVIILIVVTLVLALIILMTIILIRRVDRQRRLYHAKQEETKADTSVRHFYPCQVQDVESPSGVSDDNDDFKECSKKKKEVSFSLDEDNNINQTPTMTTFNPVVSEKYDPLVEADRDKLKNDVLTSNHYQAESLHKSSSSKKDIHSFNFHQVHPTGSNVLTNRQAAHPHRHHDDNLSDASGDLSTSDSGRGGSDVELQSHGGVSKDSGDSSFTSQRVFNSHNNLSSVSSTSSNVFNNSSASVRGGASNKSVHFQNIHPDPVNVGSFLSPMASASFMGRQPRVANYAIGGAPTTMAGASGSPLFAPNLSPNEVISNRHATFNMNGRRPSPSSQATDGHRNQSLINFSAHPSTRHPIPFNPTGVESTDLTSGRRSNMSQRSNSGMDVTWDADTTTSGSYTVDPQELCDEIDKLFFDEVKDVIV
ncbi:protocadherin beta-14 [Biomphalaria pfeifferi]|uniref:Protocadherin beta-14 n=1 Tax=Biomphalaria pfeifferi TaxID=112525 RepID=A0AAD8C221_BIOPF|nr:protocadherin beta-14 [Biomphalaria pfeifferi]